MSGRIGKCLRTCASTGALFLLIAGIRAQAPEALPRGLDAYVQQAMTEFGVPGLALAVVKDGKVLVAKGYGVANLATGKRVDASTLFGIGSNTKAFTATALAMLVDENKIAWNDPVIKYLPEFALSDPFVTHELTVRDLLVHRSGLGLGAGDLLWWPGTTYSRKEIAQRLRFIPLATSFRSAYAYDNVLYLVAGLLIESVSGQSWENFVSDRILKKIGMDGSTSTCLAGEKTGRMATPYGLIDGAPKPVGFFEPTSVDPAGGIYSDAEDMAKWLIVQLGRGQYAGGRLFSEARSRDLWTGVTPVPISQLPPAFKGIQPHFHEYALGFDVQDLAGYKLVSHTGGLPGFLSLVQMAPEKNVGLAVLTNAESGFAFTAVGQRILDFLLGLPDTDWIKALKPYQNTGEAGLAAFKKNLDASRDENSHPSLSLEKYAGTYTDAWYGDVTIAKEDKGLVVRFSRTPEFVGDLEHWQYDTFVVRWRDRLLRADAFITFSLNPDGSVDSAKMKAFTPDVDFSFDFQDLRLLRQR